MSLLPFFAQPPPAPAPVVPPLPVTPVFLPTEIPPLLQRTAEGLNLQPTCLRLRSAIWRPVTVRSRGV
jgi:hypothetical protein